MPGLDVPVLHTPRLRLEPLSPAHSDGMFSMWSQAAVCRHSGPAHDHAGAPIPLPAATPADSDRIIEFFVRRAAAGLGFRWAMLEAGRFVGAVGFNHLSPRAELAYHLHPDAWGRGLAAMSSRFRRSRRPGRPRRSHLARRRGPRRGGRGVHRAGQCGVRAAGGAAGLPRDARDGRGGCAVGARALRPLLTQSAPRLPPCAATSTPPTRPASSSA